MSRHSNSGSTSHFICQHGPDNFRISWVVDRYYKDCRQRFPTQYNRDTDLKGAIRFARKWEVTRGLPECLKEQVQP